MKILLPAALAALAGTAALAQGTAAPPASPMADGAMTRDEALQMARDHFGRLDSNHDGTITTEEVSKGREKFVERRATRDGAPHRRERGEHRRGDPNAAFDRLDANKDGSISRDEFAKAREERIEKRIVIREQAMDKARDAAREGRTHEMRAHRMAGRGHARMIVMADSNRDGKITLGEAEAMAVQHFDRMDSNKDGRVTPEERRAAMPMMIKRMQAPDAG